MNSNAGFRYDPFYLNFYSSKVTLDGTTVLIGKAFLTGEMNFHSIAGEKLLILHFQKNDGYEL